MGGEWHSYCDILLGYYWPSDDTSKEGSSACETLGEGELLYSYIPYP